MNPTNVLGLVALCVVLLTSAAVTAKERLHIAVASSLRGPVDEITSLFEQHYTAYDVTVAYVASGKLVAQVTHGAPYALLISAEPRYLAVLHSRGLTAGAPETLGYGELVLWHPKLRGSVTALLAQTDFIAIAQPKHAPYGQAAMTYLQQSLPLSSYSGKIVFGENVAQAAHRVHLGAAEIGFVALSQVLDLQVPTSDYTRLPESPLLPQSMALTLQGKESSGAQLLYRFFLSEVGQATLTAFGYRQANSQESHYAATE